MGTINHRLMVAAFRVWLVETVFAAFNYFVLMTLIYQPLWGDLPAHLIGMTTRIVVIFLLAYLLLEYEQSYSTRDLIAVGILWLFLEEVMEWGGSLLLGRSVREILIGWNIVGGYMWPYVMLSYLLSPLLVGRTLHPGSAIRHQSRSGGKHSGTV